MLMQLPVPLLCINKTPRTTEISAGEQGHSFLFGGQGDGMRLRISQRAVDQNPMAGIRDISELSDVVPA
jgi:hypothetical protein